MTMFNALAGDWTGDEEIATTRWGQGGPAKGFIQARIDLGGRALVQDYREERDGKLTLQAHAVFVTGPDHDQCSLYWFDSYGFVPGGSSPVPITINAACTGSTAMASYPAHRRQACATASASPSCVAHHAARRDTSMRWKERMCSRCASKARSMAA